jgi:hypothetical protein
MLNFIKKLFGFGKEEVKTENAEKALAETISHYKEDVTVSEDVKTGEFTINIGNKSKEDLEKIVNERMAEISSKKEEVKEVVSEVKEEAKAVVKKKKKYYAPKPKKDAPKEAPKKSEAKAPAPTTPKKATKKGKN